MNWRRCRRNSTWPGAISGDRKSLRHACSSCGEAASRPNWTGPAQLGTVAGGGGTGRIAGRTGGRGFRYGPSGIVSRLRRRRVLFECTFLHHCHGLGFVITFVVPSGADSDVVAGLKIADLGVAAGSVGVFGGTGVETVEIAWSSDSIMTSFSSILRRIPVSVEAEGWSLRWLPGC